MHPLPFPDLEPAASFEVEMGPPAETGETGTGTRHRILAVLGGRVEGPAFSGWILPGGSDAQVVRIDGVTQIDARYVVQTGRGTHVHLRHIALRRPDADAPDGTYFRGVMSFTTDDPELRHLEQNVFLATASWVEDLVRVDVLRVL